ncbi:MULTISPECIES: hypothetical protein [Haloarcula]|uniref:hypothetical protein n=1 Tax=Haloarcula TaxID=2237 RepID=UPI0023EBFC57|nr:hypothetical protein [Halomicroarcula sp. XH51]
MDLDRLSPLDTDSLDQLAAFTGLGWTTSLCGFLALSLGYGPGVFHRALVDSRLLLYVSAGCFLATLGLDRLARRLADRADPAEGHADAGAQPAD